MPEKDKSSRSARSGEKSSLWHPRPCPVCKAMSVKKYHPFCSPRCADIDLGRWLGGRYAIPGPSTSQKIDNE